MHDLQRMLRSLRGSTAADRQSARRDESSPSSHANAPLDFGSRVLVYPDHFAIGGQAHPRRTFPTGPALEPLPTPRRPRRDDDWPSQLAGIPAPGDLQADVPREQEIFTFLTPTMAGLVARMATIDGARSQRGFILLLGPTGCGKTTLAKTYCFLANQPVTELSFSGDTTLTDFYTSVEVVRAGAGQSTVTVAGPAVEAMLRGKKLLLNELNMLSPDILSVFTQAMDTGRLLVSGTERGNVEIEVHPHFGIIATANPSYVGTIDLGRAVERRFGRGLGYIEMDFIRPEEEAPAIGHELARTLAFGTELDPASFQAPADVLLGCAELAAALRSHPQIGEIVRSRLSTRSLVHWLGLAAISGLPLADVARRATLTTAPAEARAIAYEAIDRRLGATRLTLDLRGTGAGRRVAWPDIPAAATTPVQAIPVQPGAGRVWSHRDDELIHRVRYQRILADGTLVLVGEPLHRRSGQRVGLGVKLRVYDREGRQVVDPARVARAAAELRGDYGVNVPRPIGHQPRLADTLQHLTPTSLRYLELAEAALLLGRPVFLTGPSGCGKSSLARTLAYLRGRRIIEFAFTGETAKADLSASRRLVSGVTRWTVQAFLEALSSGLTVIVNEYNLAYPDVHSLINGLFDKAARVVLPDGSAHTVHPEARLIATGYLAGPGVKPLNEGVENRFAAVIAMDYPPIEEETALLAASSGQLSPSTIAGSVRLVDYCRRLATGTVDPASIVGLSHSSQEALRQASRRAAISTAELIALARAAHDDSAYLRLLRTGILEGATDTARRVLEPVLLQYEV